jgi:hypothetical protein
LQFANKPSVDHSDKMGCGSSVNKYHEIYSKLPTVAQWKKDFEKLQFNEDDIGRLYGYFANIDIDG